MKTIQIRGKTYRAESLRDIPELERQHLAELLFCSTDGHGQRGYNYFTRLMNQEVEYILRRSHEDEDAPFSEDDMVNHEPFCNIEINGAWYELTESEKEEKAELYAHLRERAASLHSEIVDREPDGENEQEWDEWNEREERVQALINRFDETVDNLEGADCDEWPEVYQWLMCPDLCYWLKDRGEIVLNGEYWGRQCCGQSIILDSVIQSIAFDLFSEEVPEAEK